MPKGSWAKHWENHCRHNQSYGSCLTDAKYLVEGKDGSISAMETVRVDYAKPIGKDTGNNTVWIRYVGAKKEFSINEAELHKHIIGWK